MARLKETAVDVTEGIIWKQLFTLCIPIFFSSFFQQAYTLINTFVVGQFGGKDALGGIQATTCLTELVVGFCVGLGAGCAVCAGQFFGQKDDKRLSRAVHTAMTLSLLIGLCVTVFGVIFIPDILRLMGTPEELLPDSILYSRCYLGAMTFTLMMNMGVALLRAVGDTRGPALITAVSCVVNIALDLVFVVWLRLEALGCGIATALAIANSCMLILHRMHKAEGAWRLEFRRMRIDPVILKNMVSCGLPLGIQSAAYSISNIIVQSTINSFGADAVTGCGLASRLDVFVWLVVEALGVALTTFTAQNFGARNYRRMREGYHTSLVMSLVLVGSLSLMLIFFVDPLSRFFIDDVGVTYYTRLMIHYVAPFYIFYSVVDNASGAIRGSGVSLQPMIMTLLGTCVLRIIWLFTVVPLHHEMGTMLMVYPVTWVVTAILFAIYHHSGNWLGRARERRERFEIAL